MMSFFRRNKATLICATLGATDALLDNYWIFTSTPLVDNDPSDVTRKFFYMLAQVSVTAGLWSVVGRVLDNLRNGNIGQNDAEKPILMFRSPS